MKLILFDKSRDIWNGNSRKEKILKYKIELGLPFLVIDLIYKLQIICLKGTKVIEWKQNA